MDQNATAMLGQLFNPERIVPGRGSASRRKKGNDITGEAHKSKDASEGESCNSFEGLSICSEDSKDGDLNSESEEVVDVIECNDESIAGLLEDCGVPAVPTKPDRAIKRGAKFQVAHDSVDIFNTAALDGVATNDSVPILVGEADLGDGLKGGVGVSHLVVKSGSLAPSIPITNEVRIEEEGAGVIVGDASSEQSLILKHFRRGGKKKVVAKVPGRIKAKKLESYQS
ncbi:Hypothetical predicted protein [Prunus dulcis]|uniref:Uncharacterized protein n=1 Tax=Prunus dulcis TaxID=3755 RepID=A0A5E4EL51_PRUDU|nr:Hypothetical predicted protein [Prunus dulcis]